MISAREMQKLTQENRDKTFDDVIYPRFIGKVEAEVRKAALNGKDVCHVELESDEYPYRFAFIKDIIKFGYGCVHIPATAGSYGEPLDYGTPDYLKITW